MSRLLYYPNCLDHRLDQGFRHKHSHPNLYTAVTGSDSCWELEVELLYDVWPRLSAEKKTSLRTTRQPRLGLQMLSLL